MIEFKSGFYIEHTYLNSWFLYSIVLKNDTLCLIWSKKLETCKCWKTNKEIQRLFEFSPGLNSRAQIVDLTKENGYHEYFRRK